MLLRFVYMSDGLPIDEGIAQWGVGEPNNFEGNEDGVESTFEDGKWNDLNVGVPLPVVCEVVHWDGMEEVEG